MSISGKVYFNGAWHQGDGGQYQANNPVTGEMLQPMMTMASKAQVDAAVTAAQDAFFIYKNTTPVERALFLRTCAEEILALGDELLERVSAETGYPRARAEGERARTCAQLLMFAEFVENGEHYDARIDTAQPDRKPLPKPDIRMLNQGVGPVVVFGASNFPLAFSVAGGDTASALAAGCPVLVKGHSSHPGSCELVARALAKAVETCGLPAGVFSLLMGDGSTVGAHLVRAAAVKAVGFTGSFAGGMALYQLAAARPEPIPVFAEMGSVNPVILLPQALRSSAATIAQNFVSSLTLGVGQFCVNPGLVLAIEDEGLASFVEAVADALANVDAGAMLNERICSSYQSGVSEFSRVDGVDVVAQGKAVKQTSGHYAQACLMRTSAQDFLQQPTLHEEIFGPVSLLVVCKNVQELHAVITCLAGQLTATLHAAESELTNYFELVEQLSLKVGRLVVNGFPTGVEVCPSMTHGGPFPASTDVRFTSVGTAAIKRFLRPLCYQNYPHALLPDALKNSNPYQLTRTVNGKQTSGAIE